MARAGLAAAVCLLLMAAAAGVDLAYNPRVAEMGTYTTALLNASGTGKLYEVGEFDRRVLQLWLWLWLRL